MSHSAHKGRVSLDVHLPAEPVILEGDPAYLERLVLNLTSNAVKFTDPGGEVDVTLAVSGDVAELTVRDTGMGIPREEQDRLFEKFFRSTLATEHAIQGTGLGLHIVRSIAEAHHGQISFESTPGVGTTFCFTVPTVGSSNVTPIGTANGVPTEQVTPATANQAPPTHPSGPTAVPKHRNDSAEARR